MIGARQRRRTLIGLLLIAVMTVLAVLIFLLDPLRRAFRNEVELVALFQSAPAVTPGAEVWIAGHAVGEVETLEFLPLTSDTARRLALVLRLPRNRLPMVREDASVQITSASMTGEAVVDILPGSASAPPAQPGDTLRAAPGITAADLRERIAAVRGASDSLRAESAPIAAAARERMVAVARVQSGFARAQAGLDELSRTLATGPAATLPSGDDVQRAIDRLRQAGAVVGDATAAESGVRRTIGAFRPLADHTAELGAQIDSLLARGTPNGTLARLRADSALAVALRRTRVQLDSLIADARANPFRYVF